MLMQVDMPDLGYFRQANNLPLSEIKSLLNDLLETVRVSKLGKTVRDETLEDLRNLRGDSTNILDWTSDKGKLWRKRCSELVAKICEADASQLIEDQKIDQQTSNKTGVVAKAAKHLLSYFDGMVEPSDESVDGKTSEQVGNGPVLLFVTKMVKFAAGDLASLEESCRYI